MTDIKVMRIALAVMALASIITMVWWIDFAEAGGMRDSIATAFLAAFYFIPLAFQTIVSIVVLVIQYFRTKRGHGKISRFTKIACGIPLFLLTIPIALSGYSVFGIVLIAASYGIIAAKDANKLASWGLPAHLGILMLTNAAVLVFGAIAY
ncbi:MAG: hypothetical protein LBE55_01200 [Clostridiales bacterium]|jgi:hypothetical protein|nr:hypothetical protein [Clostridiales bacterium]